MKHLLRAAVLGLGVLLPGCGDSTSSDTGPTVQASVAPQSIAAGGDVTVTITVARFTLEAPVGQPNVADHGHYQIYLDNATGGNYLVADAAGSAIVTIPGATAQGPHTLTVELVNNDSSPLVPPVTMTIDLTVQ